MVLLYSILMTVLTLLFTKPLNSNAMRITLVSRQNAHFVWACMDIHFSANSLYEYAYIFCFSVIIISDHYESCVKNAVQQ